MSIFFQSPAQYSNMLPLYTNHLKGSSSSGLGEGWLSGDYCKSLSEENSTVRMCPLREWSVHVAHGTGEAKGRGQVKILASICVQWPRCSIWTSFLITFPLSQVGCPRAQWGKQVWVGGRAAGIYPLKGRRSSRHSVPLRVCFWLFWRNRSGDHSSQALVCESYMKHASQQVSLKSSW